jgi:pyrroline-5-carboxylate reductase
MDKFDSSIKIGFIGAGNMAKAIIEGLLKSQSISPENIYISHPSAAKTKSFSHLNISNESESNEFVVKNSDIIVLCVKPQIFEYVCKPLVNLIESKRHLIVSIAAGINMSKLEKIFGASEGLRIGRCTLNTAALIGASCSVFSQNGLLKNEDKLLVNKLLSSVGPCMGEIKGMI